VKKKEIVKKNYEFEEIINSKNYQKNKYYSCYFVKNNNKNKYGISVPKKIGNAVTRNKIKRQLKSIIDKNKIIIPNSYDYVIIVKKEILNLNYLEKEQKFLSLIKKIKGENYE